MQELPPCLVWFFVLFIVQPLGEYVGHRALHFFRVKAHMEHHRNITRQNYEDYTPSNIPLVISVTGWIVFPSWALLWACILKYQLVHFLLHVSDAFPKLRKHHMIHHFSNSRMNYGFSETWIDELVGTSSNSPS